MECGYDVEVQKNVQLARGDVNIDVWADDHSSPQNIIAVECKHWATPAIKNVVHGFRTVVGDSGANTGLIVSSAGFQQGAVEAAAYSNVRLLNWFDFQAMFAGRWFRQYMSPTLADQTDALREYTEPVNSDITGEADALSADQRERLEVLRECYAWLEVITFLFSPVYVRHRPAEVLPSLPMRTSTVWPYGIWPHGYLRDGPVPNDVLDAPALRPLMDALLEHSRHATAEFNEVFGRTSLGPPELPSAWKTGRRCEDHEGVSAGRGRFCDMAQDLHAVYQLTYEKRSRR